MCEDIWKQGKITVLLVILALHTLLLLLLRTRFGTYLKFTVTQVLIKGIWHAIIKLAMSVAALPWIIAYGAIKEEPPDYLPKRLRQPTGIWAMLLCTGQKLMKGSAEQLQNTKLGKSVIEWWSTAWQTRKRKQQHTTRNRYARNHLRNHTRRAVPYNMTEPMSGEKERTSGMSKGNRHWAQGSAYWETPPSTQGSDDNKDFDDDNPWCNNKAHFIGMPENVEVTVKGFDGQKAVATLRATMAWSFANDKGETHTELIPNAYHNETSQHCMYSPQHVAQVAKDNDPVQHGTNWATHDESVELYLDQRSEELTVKLGKASNIAIVRSAPAYNRLHAFCAKAGETSSQQDESAAPSAATTTDDIRSAPAYSRFRAFCKEVGKQSSQQDGSTAPTAAAITDDEDSDGNSSSDEESVGEERKGSSERRHPDLPDSGGTTVPMTGEMHALPPEGLEVQAEPPQAGMLAWHYRLRGTRPVCQDPTDGSKGRTPSQTGKCLGAEMRGMSGRQGHAKGMALQGPSQHEKDPTGDGARLCGRHRSDGSRNTRVDCTDERISHAKTIHCHHIVRQPFQQPLVRLSAAVDGDVRDGQRDKRNIRRN